MIRKFPDEGGPLRAAEVEPGVRPARAQPPLGSRLYEGEVFSSYADYVEFLAEMASSSGCQTARSAGSREGTDLPGCAAAVSDPVDQKGT